MIREDYIKKELADVAPSLLLYNNEAVYTVLPLYFHELASEIMGKINAGAEPVYHLPQGLLYTTPQNYFENLPQVILQKIKNDSNNTTYEELENVAPLLNTIGRKNVYVAPTGYFDTFYNEKTPQAVPAKVVSFEIVKTIYRYTMAAAVIALMAVSIFLLVGRNDQAAMHAGIDRPKTEVKNLSEDDIVEFLGTNMAESAKLPAGGQAAATDIYSALHEMPDEEIAQYLQESDGHEGI